MTEICKKCIRISVRLIEEKRIKRQNKGTDECYRKETHDYGNFLNPIIIYGGAFDGFSRHLRSFSEILPTRNSAINELDKKVKFDLPHH